MASGFGAGCLTVTVAPGCFCTVVWTPFAVVVVVEGVAGVAGASAGLLAAAGAAGAGVPGAGVVTGAGAAGAVAAGFSNSLFSAVLPCWALVVSTASTTVSTKSATAR